MVTFQDWENAHAPYPFVHGCHGAKSLQETHSRRFTMSESLICFVRRIVSC